MLKLNYHNASSNEVNPRVRERCEPGFRVLENATAWREVASCEAAAVLDSHRLTVHNLWAADQ